MERTTSTLPGSSPDLGESEASSHSATLPIQTPPSISDAVAKAFSLDTFHRFIHFCDHAKSLIGFHGQYTTLPGLSIFKRAPQGPSSPTAPSTKALAYSLAAAQDSIHTNQPAGPAKDDLQLFKLLWDATIDVPEKALDEANLDLEVRAWGIIGLTAGYTGTQFTSAADKVNFGSYKGRLKAALNSLPTLSSLYSSPNSGVSADRRVFMLTKARREVHICSNLLIQQFRKEGWTGIRWYHGIAVAEKWVGNLGVSQTYTAVEKKA